MDWNVRKWHKKDDEEHGKPHLNLDNHSFLCFGPVADGKGRLEFTRLIDVFNSIKRMVTRIYMVMLGLWFCKEGQSPRYVHSGNGYHRSAVMVALGYNTVPAYFFKGWIVSLDEVDYWRQVQNGIWQREDAVRYFNHLFDFDSYRREKKLIVKL